MSDSKLTVFSDPILFQKWMNVRNRLTGCGSMIHTLSAMIQNNMEIDKSDIRSYKKQIRDFETQIDQIKEEVRVLGYETINKIINDNEWPEWAKTKTNPSTE